MSYSQMKIIECENYKLRPIKLSDAKDLYEYFKIDLVVKYLPFNKHKNINDTKKFINNFFIKNYKKGRISHLAVVSKRDNKVIGNIGFNNINVGDKIGEIGICINPNYWGDNLSTKLGVCMLMYGFEYLNLEKVIAITYEDNKYSQKGLINLGMRFIKTYNKKIKNQNIKCNLYEIKKEEYFNNKMKGIYENIIISKIIY